jgi:hypothetical protein
MTPKTPPSLMGVYPRYKALRIGVMVSDGLFYRDRAV